MGQHDGSSTFAWRAIISSFCYMYIDRAVGSEPVPNDFCAVNESCKDGSSDEREVDKL